MSEKCVEKYVDRHPKGNKSRSRITSQTPFSPGVFGTKVEVEPNSVEFLEKTVGRVERAVNRFGEPRAFCFSRFSSRADLTWQNGKLHEFICSTSRLIIVHRLLSANPTWRRPQSPSLRVRGESHLRSVKISGPTSGTSGRSSTPPLCRRSRKILRRPQSVDAHTRNWSPTSNLWPMPCPKQRKPTMPLVKPISLSRRLCDTSRVP